MTVPVRVIIWERGGDIIVTASHRDIGVERKACRECADASAAEEAENVICNAIHALFGALRDRAIATAITEHRDALAERILSAKE